MRSTGPEHDAPFWRHINIYAYRREALDRFASLPVSTREAMRKLEQLRALDNDMRMAVVRVDSVPLSVGVPADLEAATCHIEEKTMKAKIAYQGEPGANSHIACIEAYPEFEPLSCRTFEDAFQAVKDGEAALAMIPIDNSVAGRVADIHHLLPAANLHIVGEYFLRVHHQLLAMPGVSVGGRQIRP